MNQYMQLTQNGGSYARAKDGTCNLKAVLSETYIHMWTPSYDLNRAYGGVAITSGMMELVPKHFMGRVQNTFYFAATALQLGLSMLVGSIAHRRGLAPAFAIVGSLYLLACLSGTWPAADMLTPAEEKHLVGQA